MAKHLTRRLILTASLLMATVGLRPGSVVMAREEMPGEADITGNVRLTDADGVAVPGSGARLTLICEPERTPRVAIADVSGAFRFEKRTEPRPARSSRDLQGFKSEKVSITTAETTELQFHLELEPVFAGITVIGDPAGAPIGCHFRRGCVRAGREAGSVRGRIP